MERPPPARAHAADSRTSHEAKNTATKTAEILINLFVRELTHSSPVELFAILKSIPEILTHMKLKLTSSENSVKQIRSQSRMNPASSPAGPLWETPNHDYSEIAAPASRKRPMQPGRNPALPSDSRGWLDLTTQSLSSERDVFMDLLHRSCRRIS